MELAILFLTLLSVHNLIAYWKLEPTVFAELDWLITE